MLEKEILENIAMYENILKSIYEIYEVLFKLEENNLKDSNEYKEALVSLKKYTEFEKNVLDRFKVPGKLEEIIKYMEEKYQLNVGININLSSNYTDVIKARIANSFHEIRISFLKLKKEEFSSMLFIREFYNDVIRFALSIFIGSNRLKEKDKLKMKYKVSSSMISLESEFISRNFEIDEKPFIGSGLLIRSDIESLCAEAIKDNEVNNLFTSLAEKLASLNNNVYYDSDKLSANVFYSAIIRASLTLASDAYKNMIHEKMGFLLFMLQKDQSSKVAYDLLYESIKSIENDKKLPQYLNLIRK